MSIKNRNKFKNLELGDIEVVDLNNEENLNLIFENLSNDSNKNKASTVNAYAFYGTTSGCSDSCGSSTYCC